MKILKKRILPNIILHMISFIMVAPVLLVILSSLLPDNILFSLYDGKGGIGVQVKELLNINIQHYITLFSMQKMYAVSFVNSVIITVSIVAGNTLLSILAAYIFAKVKFRGSELIFYIFILIMLLPVMVKLVPNFIIIQKIGFNGTLGAVILLGIFNPFGIFILKLFMESIPDEYVHSARMDGTTYIGSLFRIIVPMSKAGIFAVIVFNILDSWNMIEQPLVFLNDEMKYPMSLFLFSIRPDQIGAGFAASTLFMLPVLAVFYLGRNYLIRGMYLSGL